MKKFISFLMLSMVFFASCSSDDSSSNSLSELTIQITSKQEVKDYSNFQVTLTELQSGQTSTSKANSEGVVVFKVPNGTFKVVTEDLVDDAVTMSGEVLNFIVSEHKTIIELPVELVVSPNNTSFVIDELYFNGAKNGYAYTYYEQYFTIRNITNKAIYADGLSFGVAGDFNSLDVGDGMSKFLPNDIIISQFYTIPGNGKTYRVEPNASLVIAFSAINHNESGNQPKSLDLSGADLEIYVQGGMTVDNPEVPNVIVNHSIFEAFHWQYSGATPMILFRLPEDADTFLAKNKVKLANPLSMGSMIQDYVKLSSDYVIDAVETGLKEEFYHKVLPNAIDRGSILIAGSTYEGFLEQFVQRKTVIDKDGKQTIQDTNNSTEDFVLNVGGQKSYPKKK
ncbi:MULTISPECIES: DUF4876 domain-containing protein [Myroides]|uniref:DUF4876 domain-containing protein n=1 Tax=Myroides TaxID=76831 RepID=UPI000280AC86|nr:DUF4876 domain-containing protein [Myroides odoratimimus]EKB06034.1 hypothetical protein HMPREF9711_00890 [Myroides odoratimimus CCUG 3837]